MLPILTTEQIRLADAHTIAHEPVASIDLMERAATACARKLMESLAPDVPVVVLAGMGNNGGDGLAMARILTGLGKESVQVMVLRYKAKGSSEFETNLLRLREANIAVKFVDEGAPLPSIPPGAIVVDALFGTGLDHPVTGWLKELIVQLNALPNEVLSIDLPSGLFAGENGTNDPEAIVQADRTFTLELPKYALFMPDHARFAGTWEVVPIGLDQAFIASLKTDAAMIESADAAMQLPLRSRTAHKGNFGHAWLLAGGRGKMGAALLAAKAALRSGCGLLTAHVPADQGAVLHAAMPEAMVSLDETACLSVLPRFNKATAIGVGPGMGTEEATACMLKLLIQNAPAPLVLDADALNILAENRTWLAFLPSGTILTPHPKEFERFTGKAESDGHRLRLAKEMALRFKVVLVLKGAYTAVCAPDGRVYFNATGNPGMAKGGSGDVLTGIITSLRAQGLDSLSSALLGVHAHGLAGDLAAEELGMDGMLPSDLIGKLPLAWKQLRQLAG
ncbi:MAG: NAD(P)H-hydrate dehydratase [Bacteroidetes bacterium]|nr:NAD(P)H-hydrate dehydratase [Bacteroidota bacterium]MBS1942077.1 NAD(P)H-hydrate dehydratase [Bacteroidota bacterium]